MSESKAYPLACAWLNRIREAERKVERIRQRIANLRMLTTDDSVHLTDMPRGSSPDQQKLATLMAEIDESERELAEEEIALKAIRKEIVNTVNSLDNELLQKILIFRYIQKMEWQDIATEIQYARSHTFRLYDQALAALEKHLRKGA